MTRSRVRRGDDGVVVVELALILPVLVMLLLGTITGAMAWNQSMAMGHGARVAARWASTVPLPVPVDAASMDGWLDDVADRTVAASEGQLAAGVAGRTVCVAYVEPAQTAMRTLTANGARTSHASPCFEPDTADRHVQVRVQRSGYLDTGLYRFDLTLQRQVTYRYEAFLEL